ncbi:DUF84 family protein [Brevibacillus fulvus]|uniref:inosine/xanthosine triphosphatase n=1 Tax=Brevibacillus fulvus TaxID=1125967 RepID=A0A938XZ27_9BACL|nr:inosine/xanthosine triphosphatase [Brevibacillus fulvus]MBM7590829.1 inosine/xanthosine triphosphatase [Brevibacillus fulvus]
MDFSGIKLALGTTNRAKQEAVIRATGQTPLCAAVPSQVSDQPLSEAETVQGAINRAKAVLEAVPEAQIGLGMEGGLTFDDQFTNQWYLISVCAAWNGRQLYLGKGLAFPIPAQIGERVKREGIELRTVIDEWSGTEGNHQKGGAYGLLTAGRINRPDVFCEAVLAALTPFCSPLYK